MASIDRVALELGLSRVRGGSYTWNGYQVLFEIYNQGEGAGAVSVEILAGISGRLLIRRSSSWTTLFRRILSRKSDQPATNLEWTGTDELCARLASDPVMAKTLPRALARSGEEIRIYYDGRLRVSRSVIDGIEEDALKAAWALAMSVFVLLGIKAGDAARRPTSSTPVP